MRADARRNRDAVLDAAAELLAARPAASVREVADASGLGRATVYRHFPARKDLVAALVERVGEDVSAVLERAVAGGADTPTVLRRLAADGAGIGRHWGFLADVTGDDEPDEALAGAEREFLDWVRAAQSRGELVAGDPAWIAAATRALIQAAASTLQDPEAAKAAAGDALVRAFAV